MRSYTPIFVLIIAVIVIIAFVLLRGDQIDLPQGESVPLESSTEAGGTSEPDTDGTESTPTDVAESQSTQEKLTTVASEGLFMRTSTRQIFVTDEVNHSIPINEIRQGCFGRDCIPSVDDPVFVSVSEGDDILPDDTIGIGLVYKGVERFYPFNMLVTREIVNDTVANDPLVITYCPLCGTGIVFSREIGGKVFEFGVSGMLWQSNLLMYNRESDEAEISLWSQVLGEAVLGEHTGTVLPNIPSDIVRYTSWRKDHPNSEVLNTGRIGDPYNGDYYRVANSFRPNFDENESPLAPTAYVFGVELDGKFKAYPTDALPSGKTKDTFAGRTLIINKEEGGVVRIFVEGDERPLPVVSGFWFSWFAAHPETELFK